MSLTTGARNHSASLFLLQMLIWYVFIYLPEAKQFLIKKWKQVRKVSVENQSQLLWHCKRISPESVSLKSLSVIKFYMLEM